MSYLRESLEYEQLAREHAAQEEQKQQRAQRVYGPATVIVPSGYEATIIMKRRKYDA